MATLTLRRFSNIEMLGAIRPEHFRELLAPYADYLASRGAVMPPEGERSGLGFAHVAQVLMTPDPAMPQDLVEALYYIHEMATPQGFEAMIQALEEGQAEVHADDEATALDLAIQLWLKDPRLLERLHAEQSLHRPRSFEYFRSGVGPVQFMLPGDEAIARLESELNAWFVRKRRGRTAKVFHYVQPDSIWFLVRHGEPFKCENVIQDGGESACIVYRPEKFDVIVYEPATGEIRINARTKGERELYRTAFGRHFFGYSEFFSERSRFNLEPLVRSGQFSLVCLDIPALEWIKLKEIQMAWGGGYNEVEVRRAEDVFAALAERGESLPRHIRLLKATFLVKFRSSKTPRTVVISSSNRAQYKRDDDGGIIEEWMRRRGFIGFGEEAAGAAAEIVEMY